MAPTRDRRQQLARLPVPLRGQELPGQPLEVVCHIRDALANLLSLTVIHFLGAEYLVIVDVTLSLT